MIIIIIGRKKNVKNHEKICRFLMFEDAQIKIYLPEMPRLKSINSSWKGKQSVETKT